MVHTPEETWVPKWLVTVGFVGGAIVLLAEVLVLEGMGMSDMGAGSRDEVVALVGGVRVVTFERPQGELRVGDGMIWEE